MHRGIKLQPSPSHSTPSLLPPTRPPPQVNGSDVRNATHQQAVQWLVSQQGDIELLVRHVPQPEGLQVR